MSEHSAILKNIDVQNFFFDEKLDIPIINYMVSFNIHQLFWIALSELSDTYKLWFDSNFEKISSEAFPEIDFNTIKQDASTFREFIEDHNKRQGLLAEVGFELPFELPGTVYTYCIYGESREELYCKIRQKAEEIYRSHFGDEE